MTSDLREAWADLGIPAKGCVRCRKEVNNDGSKVEWRCAGCHGLVCRECTLTLPGWRRPTEPHGKAGYDPEPSAGGREYYHDTLCSKQCWERVGGPDE